MSSQLGPDAADGRLGRAVRRSRDELTVRAHRLGGAGDFLGAGRRRPSVAMLARARITRSAGLGLEVPVVDAEGIIGLKVQAMVNDPARRDRERDDIRELLIAQRSHLDLELVREYHRVFGLEEQLEQMLREIEAS